MYDSRQTLRRHPRGETPAHPEHALGAAVFGSVSDRPKGGTAEVGRVRVNGECRRHVGVVYLLVIPQRLIRHHAKLPPAQMNGRRKEDYRKVRQDKARQGAWLGKARRGKKASQGLIDRATGVVRARWLDRVKHY